MTHVLPSQEKTKYLSLAHSQGAMLDELGANLCEVLEMLADEGEP